jgi:hypothetical protein
MASEVMSQGWREKSESSAVTPRLECQNYLTSPVELFVPMVPIIL